MPSLPAIALISSATGSIDVAKAAEVKTPPLSYPSVFALKWFARPKRRHFELTIQSLLVAYDNGWCQLLIDEKDECECCTLSGLKVSNLSTITRLI